MSRVTLVLGLLMIFLSTAYGQGTLLQTKIPFEFVAGGKALPAGNYDFGVANNLVQITNRDTRKTVSLGLVTRIAGDKTASASAHVSFDVKDGKHFIEAFWPERGDGYLLHTVKGEHTHEVVGSQ